MKVQPSRSDMVFVDDQLPTVPYNPVAWVNKVMFHVPVIYTGSVSSTLLANPKLMSFEVSDFITSGIQKVMGMYQNPCSMGG